MISSHITQACPGFLQTRRNFLIYFFHSVSMWYTSGANLYSVLERMISSRKIWEELRWWSSRATCLTTVLYKIKGQKEIGAGSNKTLEIVKMPQTRALNQPSPDLTGQDDHSRCLSYTPFLSYWFIDSNIMNLLQGAKQCIWHEENYEQGSLALAPTELTS